MRILKGRTHAQKRRHFDKTRRVLRKKAERWNLSFIMVVELDQQSMVACALFFQKSG